MANLPNWNRVRACDKQIYDAFTYAFFMLFDIVGMALQHVSQERYSLHMKSDKMAKKWKKNKKEDENAVLFVLSISDKGK